MSIENQNISRLLTTVVEYISVPQSYYEKGADRHRSLGEWLQRRSAFSSGHAAVYARRRGSNPPTHRPWCAGVASQCHHRHHRPPASTVRL